MLRSIHQLAAKEGNDLLAGKSFVLRPTILAGADKVFERGRPFVRVLQQVGPRIPRIFRPGWYLSHLGPVRSAIGDSAEARRLFQNGSWRQALIMAKRHGDGLDNGMPQWFAIRVDAE